MAISRRKVEMVSKKFKNALPSLGFVIFLQNFVKGTDWNYKEKSRNDFQEDQEDALPNLGFFDISSTFCP